MKKLSGIILDGVQEEHLQVVVKTPGTCVPPAAVDFSHLFPIIRNVIHIVSPPIAAIAILLSSRTLLLVVLYSPALPFHPSSDHWISHLSLVSECLVALTATDSITETDTAWYAQAPIGHVWNVCKALYTHT